MMETNSKEQPERYRRVKIITSWPEMKIISGAKGSARQVRNLSLRFLCNAISQCLGLYWYCLENTQYSLVGSPGGKKERPES